METSNYSAIILPQAESDITDILEYIANDLSNPTAATNLWSDIKEAIGRAKMYPFAMPLIKNQKITLGEEYRRIDVDNYVIIYKIYEKLKEIRIFAVLYGPSNVVSKVLNRV
jgi:plasmid stabilization system protein ParE